MAAVADTICGVRQGASHVTIAQRVRDTRGWPRTGERAAVVVVASGVAGLIVLAGSIAVAAEAGSAVKARANKIGSTVMLA